MAIPFTNLHAFRVVNQIVTNLVNLQHDMVANASAWKVMAQAQSPPLATLQGFITSAATQYQTRLQWVTDLRADQTKRSELLTALAKLGFDETADIVNFVQALQTVATVLQSADISSYAKISAGCDQIMAAVSAPFSLWPE